MRNAYRIERSVIGAGELKQPLPSSPAAAAEREQGPPRLRVRGLFLVSGFAFGVLVGEAFFGGPFPAALVGLVGGMLVEFLSNRN